MFPHLGYGSFFHMAMDQYLLIPFLGEWTSIYQLFWCSPGVQGFDPSPHCLVFWGRCKRCLPIACFHCFSWIQRINTDTERTKNTTRLAAVKVRTDGDGCHLYREKTIFSSENPHFCPIPMFSGEDKCFWFYHILGTVLYHRGFHWIPLNSIEFHPNLKHAVPKHVISSHLQPRFPTGTLIRWS